MAKPAELRELPFDHEGHRFVVKASPGMNGYDLGLWKDGMRVRGFGFVSWDSISDATRSGSDADMVGDAMVTIRDAVLTENVRDPEPPRHGDGH